MDHTSGIWLPPFSILAVNYYIEDDVIIYRHEVITILFDVIILLLSRRWPKFHVNINTGSGVMTSFIYERLDQKSGSRNLKIWILFNVRQPERVTDTVFSDGCLLWIVTQSFKVVSIQLLPFQSYFGITNRGLPPAD